MIYTDTTVSGSHLTPDASNASTEGYVADAALSAIPANIQAIEPSQVDLYGGAYSSTYKMFVNTTASGIVEGDRIHDNSTGVNYIVKDKKNLTIKLGAHLEYILNEELV